VDAPAEITCTECNGTAHLLSQPPPDVGFTPGDAVAYVCGDCGQRLDVVLDEESDPSGD
jgi:hypothetical protein